MINKQELKKFLIKSNRAGFASGDNSKWTKESDNSTTIEYKKGDWKSHDNYFGGEPYGGRIIVFHKERPVWIMVYYGWVKEGIENKAVYSILQNALKQMPREIPLRGPKNYKEKSLTYQNEWEGDISKYSGQEKILQNGKIVYEATYIGGLVDQ